MTNPLSGKALAAVTVEPTQVVIETKEGDRVVVFATYDGTLMWSTGVEVVEDVRIETSNANTDIKACSEAEQEPAK